MPAVIVIEVGNEYSLLDADREIINNYLAFKLDSGLSVSTIQRTITCIKSFYLFLYDNGLIKNIFDEKGGGLEISKAENVLNNL